MADDEEPIEEDAAVGEEADEEGGEEEKKSKLPLIIVIVTVLILAIFGGLYFTGMLDSLLGGNDTKTESVEGEGEEAKKDDEGSEEKGDYEGKEGADSGPQFMEIPDIIVNLNSTSGKTRFLKLKVQVEVKNGADLEKVQAVAPRVVDHFQTYLRELRVEDLKGSAGIYRLRQELVRRVNAAAYPVKVTDVLFQEILIQ